jgi:hypothetical protein
MSVPEDLQLAILQMIDIEVRIQCVRGALYVDSELRKASDLIFAHLYSYFIPPPRGDKAIVTALALRAAFRRAI